MTPETQKMVALTVGLAIAVAALIVFVYRDNKVQLRVVDNDNGAASPDAIESA